MGKKDADRQFELWRTWKEDPTEENLTPLLTEFEPDIEWRVGEFSRANQFPVPEPALRSKSRLLALKGLQTYNPDNRGDAGVRTWVNIHLKKLRSFAVENQNFGRIPEQRALRIGDYDRVKSDLEERLGTTPDAVTLSEALQEFNPKYTWSVAEVERMEKERRQDRIESMSLESDTLPSLFESEERDILRYIYHDLTMQERMVYEYTLGINGKPKLPAKDIAVKMGISGPKVSRLRTRIDQKMRKKGSEVNVDDVEACIDLVTEVCDNEMQRIQNRSDQLKLIKTPSQSAADQSSQDAYDETESFISDLGVEVS